MLLTTGVFLFNLLCALVPCDPQWKLPQVLEEPQLRQDVERNARMQDVSPVVSTTAGVVEGYLMRSMNGRDFFAFQGIYYGESTAGRNRWKSPVPKKPWRGVRQAKKPGEDCLQISLAKMLRVYGSEDCLSLNVYTPELPDPTGDISRKYPVIVYIHGGAFIMGSGSEHGPSYLLSEKNSPVLLVTLNYRLGVLGFMSTGDEVLPGNYGLKDQALALKWVHENIEFFGGDKHRVSLWGNSAGGVSTHLHMVANKTRDYFSTAFSGSGTALNYWGVQSKETVSGFTQRVAKQFRCPIEDSFKLVKCLERVNPYLLAVAQFQLSDWFPFPPIFFSPIVEPEHEDAFLTVSPEEAYKEGTVAKKPFVVGMAKDEGKTVILAKSRVPLKWWDAVMLPLMRMFPLRVMWDQIAPYFLQYKNLVGNPHEITKRVEEFYFKGKSARQASLDDFAEMASDRYLAFGIIKGLQAHAESGAPTYMYHFSFSDGNQNLADTIGYRSWEWGAGHSEDVFYFFNDSLLYDGQKQGDPDRELSSIMINLMTNYATSGEPRFTTESGELLRIWEPVENPSEIRVLQLDKKVEMIPLPRKEVERLRFWEELHLPNLTLWSTL